MKQAPPNIVKSWRVAPMPRFSDRELATALAREGYYPSAEDAFIEVDPALKQIVRGRCDDYLENYRYPLCWQAV